MALDGDKLWYVRSWETVGSEREDELVAQQMQEALESGQLNDVSDMLGIPNIDIDMDAGLNLEDDDGDDGDWDPWETDTV